MTAEQQIARAKEVFDIEIEGLRRTRDSLGESFTRTIALMQDALARGGKVVVSGVGKNLHVAEKMSAIFASTGVNSIVLNPVQAMHGDLGMTGANDVLLALSFSGESEEVVRLIPAVRRHGLKVVALGGRGAGDSLRAGGVSLRHGAHELDDCDDGDGRRARDGDDRRAGVRPRALRAQPSGGCDWPRARAEGLRHHANGRALR